MSMSLMGFFFFFLTTFCSDWTVYCVFALCVRGIMIEEYLQWQDFCDWGQLIVDFAIHVIFNLVCASHILGRSEGGGWIQFSMQTIHNRHNGD